MANTTSVSSPLRFRMNFLNVNANKERNIMKKFVLVCALACFITFLVVACGDSSSGAGSGNTDVHMGETTFVQPSITISKGSSLNMIDDTSSVHIIQNGSWDNGTSKPTNESGAPVVNSQFTGNNSATIGPFTTTGTYHLYCTVHSGMNLTVIVQ